MTMVAHDLDEYRESLAYWEARAQRLPRRAIRRRREAREMAVRWRARVAEAERAVYGRGLVGTLVMLVVERRLPLDTRRTGRHAIRRTAQVMAVFALTTASLAVLGFAALVDAVV
jgi:hypothetical protein